MNRLAFLSSTAAVALPMYARAAGRDTVILLTTSDPELDGQCTDFLAEALRSRGVAVVDPSTVQLTYHQRTEVVGIAIGPIFAVAANSVAWIERKYNSSRALFANIRFDDSEVPYGEFTMHQLRATCSFRCMDVRSGSIIKAGNYTEARHGEDMPTVQQSAANFAMLAMARSAASALS